MVLHAIGEVTRSGSIFFFFFESGYRQHIFFLCIQNRTDLPADLHFFS